jgi:PAS domain S-box-containing protein
MNDLSGRAKTERPAPELSLDAFYRAVFSHPHFLVYVIRALPDGSFLFEDANEGVARLAGLPLDRVIGARPGECLAPEMAECLETNLARCLEDGEPLTYERSIEMPDGRLSWKTSLMPADGERGPVRHVVGVTRDVTFERTMVGIADQSQALIKRLGDATSNVIYLFDLKTRGVRFITGQHSLPLGYDPAEIAEMGSMLLPRLIHAEDLARVLAHVEALAGLPDGEIVTVGYRVLHRNGRYRHHVSRNIVFSRDASGEALLVLGVAEDSTDQDRMEEEVRELSKRLLTLQIDERRRIAQELHDSTAQHLTAAGLALARLMINLPEMDPRSAEAAQIGQAKQDMEESLGEAKQEIRVLSYLLHPPVIESHGLREAVRNFALGFGERAGLDIQVRIFEDAELIGDDVSIALFRVCQEALANVHRHARASKVVVGLEVNRSTIRLSVRDDGIGFDQAKLGDGGQVGIGLAGMRERMQRLGGSVQIRGKGRGTSLVATVPWRQASAASSGKVVKRAGGDGGIRTLGRSNPPTAV